MIDYKIRKKNTPVATLFKNYVDRKSGKVAESRKEIQRRFDYLDWKDQKKILMAFLDSCATDRQWAYGKLYTLWDPSFEPKVKEVWERYREPRCAWSVIRFFPLSYIKDHLDMFTAPRDYYFIALRLAESPDYVIDRSKLSTVDYLAVLYHTGREMSNQEAADALFMVVHDMCVKGFNINDLRQQFYSQDEVITPDEFRSVENAKYYLMQLHNIQTGWIFEEWNEKVKQSILASPEFQELKHSAPLSWELVELQLSILRKYAYLALDDKYKKPTDIPQIKISSPGFREFNDTPEDLESIVKRNPALKGLVDDLNLEIDKCEIPF